MLLAHSVSMKPPTYRYLTSPHEVEILHNLPTSSFVSTKIGTGSGLCSSYSAALLEFFPLADRH